MLTTPSPMVTYINLLNKKFSMYAFYRDVPSLLSSYNTLNLLLNFLSFNSYGVLQKNIHALRRIIIIIKPRLKKVMIKPKSSPRVPYSRVK